ncbi:hypothetical protein [Thermanaerosceptrum fracticalcis]|uniref:hypothetical protein n=1 Tax=Thermanaerosceptrum fracticalcis TaxID=1712410 RepID=UPI003B838A00
MYINSNMNLGRQIYSTAHEFKHLFFDDMTVNSVYICKGEIRKRRLPQTYLQLIF